MPEQARKTLAIPSDRSQACKIQDAVMADVACAGYPESTCFAIRLALEEALANAIRHGNCNDQSKSVRVEYRVSPEQVEISVCDEGCGFCPEQVPDPTLEENLERPCGRGVMLIKAYMSEVRYNDRGNCVTMIKRRNCSLPM